MPIKIRELRQPALDPGGRDLDAFINYPYALFKDHPHWVGELKKDTRHLLDSSHPFWLHGERALFMAYRDGRPAGRIAAIVNRAHNSFHNENCGFFGFFDCAEDPEAAAGLLAAAGKYLHDKGMDKIRGPVNPSTNETCGLLVEGFDSAPMVMMPYNPPYYAGLIEAAGYTKAKDLLAYRMELAQGFPERYEKIVKRIMRGGDVTVEFVDIKNLDAAIADLKDIYNSAWEKNWGFIPMTAAEMDDLANALKPMLKPDYLYFAKVDGKPAAFVLLLPDFNVALKAARGSLDLFTILPFLHRLLFKMRAGRLLTLGVKKEFRGRGLEMLLIKQAVEAGRKMKWKYGEMSWTLEDNAQINNTIEAVGGRVYKRYRIYEKTV
ncbi:MAG: N-acetyltransferase [Elusimicrobia bacterium CG08_land_8_20_14_0_20_59_10]|nr:MAG: N-acetyltransferase [Elusimicrobia bacterium CG08_land_8_20_14_0_20_59_10]